MDKLLFYELLTLASEIFKDNLIITRYLIMQNIAGASDKAQLFDYII